MDKTMFATGDKDDEAKKGQRIGSITKAPFLKIEVTPKSWTSY